MSAAEVLYTLAVRPAALFFDAGRALFCRFSFGTGPATAAVILILCLLALPLVLRLVKHGLKPVALNAKQRKTDRNNRILLILSSLYMAVLTGLCIPSALIAAFVFHAEPWVVYACLKCDQILKCFVAVVKVNRYKWIKQLTREQSEVA